MSQSSWKLFELDNPKPVKFASSVPSHENHNKASHTQCFPLPLSPDHPGAPL